MNAHIITIDVVVNRSVDAMLVVGFALLFSAGGDIPRAHEIDADFIPNVHLDFGPQILKRDVHTVILSELFPLGFPPGRVSTASLSQEQPAGSPSRQGGSPAWNVGRDSAPRCIHRGSIRSP